MTSREDYKKMFEHLENRWKCKQEPYFFEKRDLETLYIHLKNVIKWQDEVIMQYIKNFHLYLYRWKNNENNLWSFWQFWPSGTGKNFVLEEIAKVLWFETHIIDLSSYFYVEMSSLFWSASGFNTWEDAIMQWIYEKAVKNDWKMILVFDEIEKWKISENWSFAGFLSSIMNMLHNKEMELKNINKTINFQNFIFVFNSNMWFDNFDEEKVNTRKIWFDMWDDISEIKKTDEKKHSITAEKIKNMFKNDYKVSVSVYNRLFRWDNILIFNPISLQEAEKFFESEFVKMTDELKNNMRLKKEFDIEKYRHHIENYDILKGYRGVKDIVHTTIKSEIMNNHIKMKWDLKIQKRKKIFK